MKLNLKIRKINHYIILFFSIVILFIILNLTNNNTTYIDIFGKKIKANEDILLKQENECYLSYNFIKENIDEQIYFDNISKKVVISSDKGLIKVKVNDKKININFEEKTLGKVGVIEETHKYISLDVLKEAYNLDYKVNENIIYLFANNYSKGKIKYNNVGIYKHSSLRSEIVDYVDKSSKINVISEKDNFVFVKINNKVGYILKSAVKYKIEDKKEEYTISQNNVYVYADSSSKDINDKFEVNGILLDMFSVTQTTTNIIEKNINTSFINKVKQKDYKIYGKIENGYELAGFNRATISQILSDESKRLSLINNLNAKIEKYKLDGIVLDFKKLQEKDIVNYIQFVKELKAFTQKVVIVSISADEYKEYLPVVNYTDFSIVNAYEQRGLNSNVSGSVSEINWMKDIIDSCLEKVSNEKLVIGTPAYTILWTEKNSNVIDSEIYNLSATQSYIKNNNLELKKVNGQNYTYMEKGSLKYKMWLEDEFSIENRVKIIKENKLHGIAIYKLGYENDIMLDILKNNY